MANKKFNITRAQALETAIAMFKECNENAVAAGLEPTYPEHVEVLTNLLASITRKSDEPKEPSKASVENAQLAKAVFAEMQPNRAYSTSEIMSLVRGIMSTQKCAQVMAVLVKAGAVTKGKDKKRVVYTLAQ